MGKGISKMCPLCYLCTRIWRRVSIRFLWRVCVSLQIFRRLMIFLVHCRKPAMTTALSFTPKDPLRRSLGKFSVERVMHDPTRRHWMTTLGEKSRKY